jgi:hypothetical protein
MLMTTKQEQRRQQEEKFYTDYYSQLIGGKITGFHLTLGEGELWPTFTVKVGKKTYTIELSQDEEGNGPGFLFGLPTPKK